MSEPEAKQDKPVRTDSHFLSTTLSQCTYMVVEDLYRVIPALSQAPFNMSLQSGRCTHPRATAINSSALSGPIKISGTSHQQLVPNWDNQHLILL